GDRADGTVAGRRRPCSRDRPLRPARAGQLPDRNPGAPQGGPAGAGAAPAVDPALDRALDPVERSLVHDVPALRPPGRHALRWPGRRFNGGDAVALGRLADAGAGTRTRTDDAWQRDLPLV